MTRASPRSRTGGTSSRKRSHGSADVVPSPKGGGALLASPPSSSHVTPAKKARVEQLVVVQEGVVPTVEMQDATTTQQPSIVSPGAAVFKPKNASSGEDNKTNNIHKAAAPGSPPQKIVKSVSPSSSLSPSSPVSADQTHSPPKKNKKTTVLPEIRRTDGPPVSRRTTKKILVEDEKDTPVKMTKELPESVVVLRPTAAKVVDGKRGRDLTLEKEKNPIVAVKSSVTKSSIVQPVEEPVVFETGRTYHKTTPRDLISLAVSTVFFLLLLSARSMLPTKNDSALPAAPVTEAPSIVDVTKEPNVLPVVEVVMETVTNEMVASPEDNSATFAYTNATLIPTDEEESLPVVEEDEAVSTDEFKNKKIDNSGGGGGNTANDKTWVGIKTLLPVRDNLSYDQHEAGLVRYRKKQWWHRVGDFLDDAGDSMVQ